MEFLTSEHNINISDLTYWYQPIYRLRTGEILGYDALVRGNSQQNIHPFQIFYHAELKGNRTILDFQMLLKAQQMFKNSDEFALFLNIFPSTLLDRGFISWWDRYSGIVPSVVLELADIEAVSEWDNLKKIVKMLKEKGIKIAIDDTGAEYSFLKYLMELEPDYLKLDRYYIEGLPENPIKQKVLSNLTKLVEGCTEIIVGGVENDESLKIIKQLGIPYAQGYYLGVPAPLPNR